MEPIGRTRWAIPEGYLPEWSTIPGDRKDADLESHDAFCVLIDARQSANALLSTIAFASEG